MKSFTRGVVGTTFAAAAIWAISRWLDQLQARIDHPPRKPMENWENEGGALAPHPGGHETSQVPR